MRIKYNNQQYDFPVGTSFEEMNEFLGGANGADTMAPPEKPMTHEEGLQALKESQGIDVPTFGKNLVGGLLKGGQGILNMLPKVEEPFEVPNVKQPNTLNTIDPYKALGTENQPFYTPQGLTQLAGELLAPGAAVNKLSAPVKAAGKSVINAFSPGAESERFMQSLGGGTATQNAERLAETIETAASNKKGLALIPKKEVMKEIGEKEFKNKEGLSYLSKENEKSFKKYGLGLKDLHNNFIEKPNFARAHELESALGKERQTLLERKKNKTLDTSGDRRLEAIDRAWKAIRQDMDVLVKDMPKHVQDNWHKFKTKYREYAENYESTETKPLTKISKGKTVGTKPSTLRSVFAHPKQNVQNVLRDLPQEGKNYVVYNELAHINPKNAEEVINKLDSMEQIGGFGAYITPEMRAAKEAMKSKLNRKNKLQAIGSLGIVPGYKIIKNALNIGRAVAGK